VEGKEIHEFRNVPYLGRLTREGDWNKEGRKRETRRRLVQTSCLVLLKRGKMMGLSGKRMPPFGTMDFSEWGLFLF
jgi:hypothetical protein